MTPFEVDLTPFDANRWQCDGDLSTTETTDSVIVWGAERPDLLLTETFASHDRQTRDADSDGDSDGDWDGVNAPITTAMFELYNPWVSSSLGLPNGIYNQPTELGNGSGINLGATANNTPVWRIALTRTPTEDNSEIVRSIYFADLGGSPYPTDFSGDSFYPSTDGGVIAPGEYVSIAPPTDPTIDSIPVTSTGTVVEVDQPRALSISDQNGGYLDPNGTTIVPPGSPYSTFRDDRLAGQDPEDHLMLNTNGIADNFRFVYLQRLANPTIAFDPQTNPYRTIDLMTVDLLAGNSLGGTPFGTDADPVVIDAIFDLRSTQRGESFTSPDVARQNFFAAEMGTPASVATEVSPATSADCTFGELNTPYVGGTFPFGSLTWNNRPFASAAELANVPYLPGVVMSSYFNTGADLTSVNAQPLYTTYASFTNFFSSNLPTDSHHKHLLRFDFPLGNGVGTINANRLARLFDFVETPSLFLGTGVRRPGLVNINTVSSDVVWNAVEGNFALAFSALKSERDVAEGPTDIAGYFTSSEGRMFVPNINGAVRMLPQKGSAGTLFQLDTANPASGGIAAIAPNAPLADGTSPTFTQDPVGTVAFKNQLRQRLSNLVTTKSSVFSIWITIGYFEVDEFGRIGAEINSATGNIKRNRAFYMVDRSIPVAFEPGRDHNVDDAVLLRTIIE